MTTSNPLLNTFLRLPVALGYTNPSLNEILEPAKAGPILPFLPYFVDFFHLYSLYLEPYTYIFSGDQISNMGDYLGKFSWNQYSATHEDPSLVRQS